MGVSWIVEFIHVIFAYLVLFRRRASDCPHSAADVRNGLNAAAAAVRILPSPGTCFFGARFDARADAVQVFKDGAAPIRLRYPRPTGA